MSPHGGKRPGAGRKADGEKRTVNLCGVRTTRTRLRLYKLAAGKSNMTLSSWVERLLDAGAGIDKIDNMVGILEFLDDGPKKRKGKKS